MRPMMGGDDFAVLAGVVPAAYAFVGAGGDAPGLPHHHPGFAIDEAALEIGLRVLLGTADRFLAGASAPGG
jgi:amidohydrolase